MKKTVLAAIALLGVCACLPVRQAAAAVKEDILFSSGPSRNTFLELYTSDVSQNCNEALRWMNSLKDAGPEVLWKRFVPVQMHVSFGDGGGAKDTFAQKSFDGFLLKYKKTWNVRDVYVPTLAVNGTEWTGWARQQDIPRFLSEDVGVLTADGSKREGHFLVEFKPSAKVDAKDLVAHAALLKFGLKSMPSEGSNRGRALSHDFLATVYTQKPFLLSYGVLTVDLEIIEKKATRQTKPEKKAIAVWVTRAEDARPIQATGGYLPS